MSSVQDSLYNWLTIKVVRDARPEDTAAVETEMMFRDILEVEHEIIELEIRTDEVFYYVSYVQNKKKSQARFPRELIEVMLNQINESPERYRIYPN